MPDCEIREWNEQNFDVNAHPYTRAAYAAGKYAFVSDFARYTEFLWEEEEERLVEHAKSLTAAVAIAHADVEVRNQEIYKQSGCFERDHVERQRAFEASIAEAALAAGTALRLPSLSVGSSSSTSY